jgi:HEAT repeat protein
LFDDVARVAADLHAPEVSRRREAVERIDAWSTDEARPHLLQALGDSDLEVRVRAAAALGRRRMSDATPTLLAILGDPEPKLRAAVSVALGLAAGDADPPWPERAARALERGLGDAEHEVREAAVTGLGSLPRPLARSAAVAITGRLDDDHPAVRQKAAAVLARLGESRAVIPLVGRLSDGSREVRMAALDALGELGDKKAAPAMIRLLGDPAEEVRSQAIQSLGRLKAGAAVPPLVELLERGAEPLRGRAAVALGQIAPSESGQAVAALVSALQRDELRQAAREGLRLAGPAAVLPLVGRLPSATGDELAAEVELLGDLGDARAAPVLLSELSRGRLPRERVVDALGQVSRNDRAFVVDLTALLGDPEGPVRRRAARALRGIVDERAAAALAEAVGDGDREVRLMAIGELGRLRAAAALPSLERALSANDAETAAAAARALGEIGDKQAAPSLEAALGRPDRRLRRDAADALGRIGDTSVVPAVMRRGKSGGETRPEALGALGGLLRGRPDPTARDLLLGYAEGGEPALAMEAVDALASMRDPQSAPRLERLLGKRDAELRRGATRALGELGADAALLGRLGDDPDAGVQAEAAWALGKSKGGATVLAALERALSSAAPEVRANAAASLARLGNAPEALGRLLHDPDPAVRANAALASRGHRQARLKELATDGNALVRAAAKRALAGAAPAARGDWLGLYLVDFDGAPLAGARYRLILPDGLVKAGQADGRGIVREESLPRGSCQLQLVDEPAGHS